MKRIDLVYFDAGGGHRAAASALRQVMGEQRKPWEVRTINLQDLLDLSRADVTSRRPGRRSKLSRRARPPRSPAAGRWGWGFGRRLPRPRRPRRVQRSM